MLALGVRLGVIAATSYRPIGDARFYLALAADIDEHGDYPSHGTAAGGSHGPTAYFPPAFPYLLAAVDELDGHTSGPAVTAARVASAVLGTAIVALVGVIAWQLLGATVALVAMALAAVYPVFVELASVIVVENLFTALVLGATACALAARRPGARPARWFALAGALTALATLSHENGAVVALPMVIAAWSLRARRRPVAAYLLAGVVVLVPWTIRNLIVLHSFVPVSDETGITLAGTYNAASAHNRAIPYAWRLDIAVADPKRLSEPQLDSRLLGRALSYIGHHPTAPLAAAAHNIARLLELEGSYAWRHSYASIGFGARAGAIGVVSFWILALLALAGAFTRVIRRVHVFVWLVPLLIGVTVVLVNAQTPRFRQPIEAFLVLPAACALATAAARVRRRGYTVRQSGV